MQLWRIASARYDPLDGEGTRLLLNPRHPDASRVEVVEMRPFSFDPRLLR